MRAAVLRGGRLEVRETADPVPGPGELLLRTLATAICASDVHYMDHPDVATSDPSGRMAYDPEHDQVMGHEFVGEVIAHGPGCTDQLPIGTRVTAMPIRLVDGGAGGLRVIGQHPEAQGSFGELLVVPEVLARAVTTDVSDIAIALTDAFAVGEYYVRVSGIAPGEIPIVLGAGAIGLSAIAALAERGVSPIIVSDLHADRRELAKTFGATITVDPRETSPFDAWQNARAEFGTTKPAVVFECVGKVGLLQQIIEECEMWTRIFAAGAHYTDDTINCTTATQKGVAVHFGGGPMPEDWYGVMEAIAEGRLDPMPAVGQIIDLDGVPAAIDQARQGHGPARIVVVPTDGRGT